MCRASESHRNTPSSQHKIKRTKKKNELNLPTATFQLKSAEQLKTPQRGKKVENIKTKTKSLQAACTKFLDVSSTSFSTVRLYFFFTQ